MVKEENVRIMITLPREQLETLEYLCDITKKQKSKIIQEAINKYVEEIKNNLEK